MGRSLKRGSFIDDHLMKEAEAQQGAERRKVIRTWSHCFTIFPSFVGFTIAVYDGRKHAPAYIQEDMVGHKLGGFAPIRIYRSHVTDDKKVKR